jgi:TonB-dependent SusC/RagA subfamily outer membrane receptor
MIGFSLRRTVATGLAALSLSAAFTVPALAQNAIIRGTVISSDRKEPIAGVNIVITELNISILSSDRGAYVITIPAARIPAGPVNVTARAIGFKAVMKGTIIRAGEQTVDFTLTTDINRLEEVVVTGVMEGTERAKVPFAVAHLSTEELPVPALDPIRALQGKVAGVRIGQTSGKPGSTPEILLRGPTSINASGRSQEPLIIVDDAIMNVGSLEELSGLDIESVEVVKGAAGASLYGTRAANGVITIRTKRGLTSGEGVKFNVRTEFGTSDFNSIKYGIPLNHPLQLDETGKRFCVATSGALCSRTVDWMTEMLRINNVSTDNTRSQQNIVYNSPSTDDLRNIFQAQIWPKQYYNTMAQVMTHNPTVLTALDATGKVGNVGFFVSTSYQDEAGAVRGFGGVTQKRARVNLDYNARSDLRISISTAYDDLYNDVRSISFGSILRGAPPGTNYLQRDTLGRYLFKAGGTGFRPTGNGGFGVLYDSENWVSDRNSKRFLGSITGKYFPADWVTFEGTFAYDNRTRKDTDYIPRGYRTNTNPSATTNGGNIALSDRIEESFNTALTATFRKKLTTNLNGKMSFRGVYDQDAVVANGSGRRAIYLVKDIFQLSNTTTTTSVPSSSSQTVKNVGVFAGATADYKDRYILEASMRYDGSSLFGAGHRWSPFGRFSGVWIVSKEPFWHLGFMDELRLRASRGTAGTTPNFAAQYETYNVSTSGITLGQAGNSNLRPETTTEIELGTDFTLFRKLGLEFTYAHGRTKDQILPVNTIAALGFSTQWQNAGTLTNKTLEVSANLPLVNSKSFYWTIRGTWDRTRTYISELLVPEFVYNGGTGQGTGSFFFMTSDPRNSCLPGQEGHLPGEPGYAAGESRPQCTGPKLNRYGNIWARHFLKNCNELAASLRTDCGPGKSYQVNDEGWLVWVGAGNSYKDGITKNLWQTSLPVAQSPWGVQLAWGHPIVDRPLAGQVGQGVGLNTVEGNVLPSFRFSFANDIQYKKLTLYGLIDATIGHKINNQGEGWGLLDLSSDHFDQKNKTVETAKPVGYSWRAGGPESTGTGGFYDVLNVNNYTLESGSFAKLREMSLTYRVGRVAGVGDWTVGVVGRNLFTITGYSGYDPEVGAGGGGGSPTGSGLINQTDAFDYPTLRTFTFSLSTRF